MGHCKISLLILVKGTVKYFLSREVTQLVLHASAITLKLVWKMDGRRIRLNSNQSIAVSLFEARHCRSVIVKLERKETFKGFLKRWVVRHG